MVEPVESDECLVGGLVAADLEDVVVQRGDLLGGGNWG